MTAVLAITAAVLALTVAGLAIRSGGIKDELVSALLGKDAETTRADTWRSIAAERAEQITRLELVIADLKTRLKEAKSNAVRCSEPGSARDRLLELLSPEDPTDPPA